MRRGRFAAHESDITFRFGFTDQFIIILVLHSRRHSRLHEHSHRQQCCPSLVDSVDQYPDSSHGGSADLFQTILLSWQSPFSSSSWDLLPVPRQCTSSWIASGPEIEHPF